MPYFLTRWALGAHQRLELTDDDYEALAKARAQITVTLGLEEKFELLLSNYQEFEQDLLRLAMGQMLRSDMSWSDMVGDRLTLARRIANLLSSARLYADQVKHDLTGHYGEPAKEAFAQSLSSEYKASLGFRILEALRNYMQHRSIPIQGIAYPATWIGEEPSKWLRFGLQLTLDRDALIADSGFKSSVARELETIDPKTLDLILYVREYVEAFARVHAQLRARIRDDVVQADTVYRAAVGRWLNSGEANANGLSVAHQSPDASFPDLKFPVTLNAVERRDELATRNQVLSSLSRRFVSGATRGAGV